ncbi:MAG TPA: hypothetical protein VHB50_22520 [Bryobacteraceae bacterium]|nr:hypothetical protein [Bryobacteraceae bacterium]
MPKYCLILLVAAAMLALAAGPQKFENRPAVLIGNNRLEVLVLPEGTMIASVVLKDDRAQLSPLWNPARLAREAKDKNTFGDVTGHFLCVDGFGSVSKEEQAAGLPGHGEAHGKEFALDSSYVKGEGIYSFTADLPIAQEHVTRTMRLREGEQVLQVDTEIESMLGFDRPIFWAEHATIGAPFLEPDVTVVDMPAVRAKTRPYDPAKAMGLPHRLPSDQEFKWPLAPGADGKFINLRAAPKSPNSGDHTTCLLDPKRKTVFVTMLNPKRRLLLGYVFRPSEYPWVQSWEFYPKNGMLARGLEFSTMPFDLPRREVIEQNSLFGTLLYRWLPAKSKVGSRFLMFYTRTPANMFNIDDVRLEKGAIVIEDAAAKATVRLTTAATL